MVEVGHESQGSQADPRDVPRIDDGKQLLDDTAIFRFAAVVDHDGVEVERQRVSVCGATGGGLQARLEGRRSALFAADHPIRVQRPGQNGSAVVGQALQGFDGRRLGFQLERAEILTCESSHQPRGEVRPRLPD